MPYVDAWQQLLDTGLDACIATLLDDTDYADNLRRVAPFNGTLAPAERDQFLASWRPPT